MDWFPYPEVDTIIENLESALESHGYLIAYPSPSLPADCNFYIYTVGLATHCSFPDFILAGAEEKQSIQLVESLVASLSEGRSLAVGERIAGIYAKGFDCRFVELDSQDARIYAPLACLYSDSLGFENPTILQLQWPDDNNILPGEKGVDEQTQILQSL